MKWYGFLFLILLSAIIAVGCETYGVASPNPVVTPTPTELEAIEAEMRAFYGDVDYAACSSCIPHESNCAEYLWTSPITRPEWQTLFPQAHFYLIGVKVIVNFASNPLGYQWNYRLIAQQDGIRYEYNNFNQLLAANAITITPNNREQVARAFAPFALANFLSEEIEFLDWQDVDRSGFQHQLTVWTRLQGAYFVFLFDFPSEKSLSVAWSYTTGPARDDSIAEPAALLYPYDTRRLFVW